jgi:hypothetical protein
MLPVDVSMNVTGNGAAPLVGAAPNEATGGGIRVVIKLTCVLVLEPPALLAINVTV